MDPMLTKLTEHFRRLAQEHPSDFRERIKRELAASQMALPELMFVVGGLSAALHNHVMGLEDRADVQTCGFCGKAQREVAFLVQSPMSCICEQCVAICVEILEEKGVALPQL